VLCITGKQHLILQTFEQLNLGQCRGFLL
jgi:hypothetical protein